MAIWSYDAEQRDIPRVRQDVVTTSCIYCQAQLYTPRYDDLSDRTDPDYRVVASRILRCCPVCGWWYVRENHLTIGPHRRVHKLGASGVLRNLDLSDQTLPLSEVRQYLAARYGDRSTIHPATLEEVVVSVYRDHGYSAQATGRTGDGGIDAVLCDRDGRSIGVQVKRYRGKIEAEQIREFTGALYLKGILRGIYVTTSTFTRGARETAAAAERANRPIELVDADRFYAQLCFAQRRAYETVDDPTAPFARASLLVLEAFPAFTRR